MVRKLFGAGHHSARKREERIAGFYSADRRTHITDTTELPLQRSHFAGSQGTSSALDVNMTMKCTHNGIDDRAAALANRPNPSSSAPFKAETADQHPSSAPMDSHPAKACRLLSTFEWALMGDMIIDGPPAEQSAAKRVVSVHARETNVSRTGSCRWWFSVCSNWR